MQAGHGNLYPSGSVPDQQFVVTSCILFLLIKSTSGCYLTLGQRSWHARQKTNGRGKLQICLLEGVLRYRELPLHPRPDQACPDHIPARQAAQLGISPSRRACRKNHWGTTKEPCRMHNQYHQWRQETPRIPPQALRVGMRNCQRHIQTMTKGI